MDCYGTIMITGVNPKSLIQLETAIEAALSRAIKAEGISVKMRKASRAGATPRPQEDRTRNQID